MAFFSLLANDREFNEDVNNYLKLNTSKLAKNYPNIKDLSVPNPTVLLTA